ncbi:MAG TPA: hypothetical protein VF071_11330 [Candidatus Limnocylindria bacterium]
MTIGQRLAIGDLLASLALILAAGASAAGLLWPELYRDNAAMTAQARGTDLATLLVAVPALGVGLWLARARSRAAQLIVLGMLGYLVYAYAIFAFQVVINPATPAYIVILGLAAWSLLLRLPVLGSAAEAGVGARLPRRVTAGFLGLIVFAFGGLWLSEIVGAIGSGALPASVSDLDLPTSAVYTLDLAFLLPAMVVAGLLLIRGSALAAPLAVALLAFSVGMVLSILGLFVFQALDGIAVDPVMAAVFTVIGLVAFVLAVAGSRPPSTTAGEAAVAARHATGAGRVA